MRAVYASTRADEIASVPWTPEQKAAFIDMQFGAQRVSYLNDYPQAEYYVIERSGRPAGRMIVDRSARAILLMDIALLPEFRNAGIGTTLLHDLLSEADRTGRPVRLHVEGFNPALRLYLRLGFVQTGQAGIYFEMVRKPQAASDD
jgi:ribosomal protein S18 acetylase RimI-like enzyme